jgi:hypothetical protein
MSVKDKQDEYKVEVKELKVQLKNLRKVQLLKNKQKKTKLRLEEQVKTTSLKTTQELMQVMLQWLKVDQTDKEFALERVKVDAAVLLIDQNKTKQSVKINCMTTGSGGILKQKRLSSIPWRKRRKAIIQNWWQPATPMVCKYYISACILLLLCFFNVYLNLCQNNWTTIYFQQNTDLGSGFRMKECEATESREHHSNCCKCSTRSATLDATSIIPRAQRVAAALILLLARTNVIVLQATQATPPGAPVTNLLVNLLPNLPVWATTNHNLPILLTRNVPNARRSRPRRNLVIPLVTRDTRARS